MSLVSVYIHAQPVLSVFPYSFTNVSFRKPNQSRLIKPCCTRDHKDHKQFCEKLIGERKIREKWKQRCFRLPCGYHGIVRVHQEQQFSENSIFNFDNVFHRMKQVLQFRQGHHLAYFYLPMQLRHQEPPTTWDS